MPRWDQDTPLTVLPGYTGTDGVRAPQRRRFLNAPHIEHSGKIETRVMDRYEWTRRGERSARRDLH